MCMFPPLPQGERAGVRASDKTNFCSHYLNVAVAKPSKSFMGKSVFPLLCRATQRHQRHTLDLHIRPLTLKSHRPVGHRTFRRPVQQLAVDV